MFTYKNKRAIVKWNVIILLSMLSLLNLNCTKKIFSEESGLLNKEFDYISIIDFGAIPNDNLDDSDAIQNSINYAIQNTSSSHIYCPPGVYDLEKGLIIANHKSNGEYHFTTLTLSGHISTYSANQKTGSTTVFKLRKPTFGIALQSARNCVVENISFVGCAVYTSDPKRIIEWKVSDWGIKANARINQYSPSCAIVIDPFHKNVPRFEQYPNLNNKYTNSSKGGSSMILIRGCSFSNHYIAIANNPSANIQNGDNISVEHSHAKLCHTFWSAGQSQSRANSIYNVYVLYINTLISGVQIGSQQGTPPVVNNLNLAGFCKLVLDIRTGFSGVNFYQAYMESIWSLGISMSTNTSFSQCQIKFYRPSKKIFMPPFLLYANNVVALRDCNIAFFDNCNTRMPLLFRSSSLLVSGGVIEGGVIVADGYTNNGGDDLHKVTLDNVSIKCLGKIAGKKNTARPSSKLKGEILMGGEIISNSEGELIINNSTTYYQKHIEDVRILINHTDKTARFISKNPKNYKLGDNIFTNQYTQSNISNFSKPISVRSPLGFISNIRCNEIIINGVPFGFPDGNSRIYIVDYPNIDDILSIKKGFMENQMVKFKKIKK